MDVLGICGPVLEASDDDRQLREVDDGAHAIGVHKLAGPDFAYSYRVLCGHVGVAPKWLIGHAKARRRKVFLWGFAPLREFSCCLFGTVVYPGAGGLVVHAVVTQDEVYTGFDVTQGVEAGEACPVGLVRLG